MRSLSALHLCLAPALLFAAGCSGELQPGEGAIEDEPTFDERAAEGVRGSIDCRRVSEIGYSNGSAFSISLIHVDGEPAAIDTADHYVAMQRDAERAGVHIQIVSGFRTNDEQKHLYHCYVTCSCNGCNLAARPGYSNHQSGRALDLNTRSSGVLSWLNGHAAAYGFHRTVPSEVWHWEHTGAGHSVNACP